MLRRMCWSKPSANRANEKSSSSPDRLMIASRLSSDRASSACASILETGAEIQCGVEPQIEQFPNPADLGARRRRSLEAEAQRRRTSGGLSVVEEEFVVLRGVA